MPLRRAALLALGWLFCLSMTGASCSGGTSEPTFGYVQLDGRTAVYAPMCGDDKVRGVRVYSAPDPGKGGDFTLVWHATDPTAQSVKDGLVILGDNGPFATVIQDAPAQFPLSLSVGFDTVGGISLAEARLRPADLPRYAAGTPVTEMMFDTADGRVSYKELTDSVGPADECA